MSTQPLTIIHAQVRPTGGWWLALATPHDRLILKPLQHRIEWIPQQENGHAM